MFIWSRSFFLVSPIIDYIQYQICIQDTLHNKWEQYEYINTLPLATKKAQTPMTTTVHLYIWHSRPGAAGLCGAIIPSSSLVPTHPLYKSLTHPEHTQCYLGHFNPACSTTESG